MPASEKHRYRPETRLVHAGQLRSQFGETSEALFLTQGFVYDTAEQCAARFKGEEPGFVYARFSNPTVAMFEGRMAAFESAEAARATASGMAAVTASLMGQVRAGDHVVAARQLFGSCRWVVEELLPRFGVASTLVDGLDLAQWRQAVRPNTKTFFLESPTNPTLDIIDIAAVARIAHDAGATLVVDNVFATPLWQSPLALGADCVVYSATKHIDGQGRCLGGVILGSEEFIQKHVHMLLRQTGPSMSPFNAWLLLKGLETLHLRVRRQTDTAAAVSVALVEHPKILLRAFQQVETVVVERRGMDDLSSQDLPQPFPHLRRGVVGVSESQDFIRPGMPLLDKLRNAIGQNRCLAGASARNDEHGSTDMFNGLSLALVGNKGRNPGARLRD